MKVVLIHGRSHGGLDPAEVQAAWEEALREGLRVAGLAWPDGLEVAFPFYADELDRLVAQIQAPVLGVATRGAAADPKDVALQAELLAELARGQGVTDAEVQAHFGGEAHERGPLNWGWVHAMFRAMDRTPLGGAVLEQFTRDVSLYLNYRTVRRVIDAIVARHLGPGPCVVVGHSLGSVIGYHVLCNAPEDVEVRRFVTVGSPLGLAAVRKRLDAPLRMPGCVRGWFNAKDPRDGVALYPLDDTYFGVDPAITNKLDVENFTDNRHGVIGYLADPTVAGWIHAALR